MLIALKKMVIKNCGIAVLRSFDALLSAFAPNKAVIDPDVLPELKNLIDHQQEIIEEYRHLIQSQSIQNIKDFYTLDNDVIADDNWKAFPLVLFGFKFVSNAQKCPLTFRLISEIPGCSAAMFSVLGPNKTIPPHSGIYKGIMRCLFTLKAPSTGKCWIKIEEEVIDFIDGKLILFDETAIHEVHNQSNENRIVLYLDIDRKLPFFLNWLNKLLYRLLQNSGFVQAIINNYSRLSQSEFEPHSPLPATLCAESKSAPRN